jgi:nucleoid-associated protein YgaU
MKRRLGLLVVLAGLVASVALLHRLGPEFPLSSLSQGPFEVALGAIARLVGLAIAYWLLGSSVLLILARLTAIRPAIRAVSWLTWRPIRRLIETSVASSLVLALSTGPATASVAPGYVPVPAGDPTTTTTAATTTPATTTVPEAPSTLLPPVPITISEPVDTYYLPIEAPRHVVEVATLDPLEVTVRAGDSIWLLAERRMRELRGPEVSDAQVAPYWLAVIAANRTRIRSGDPDLIFPGEVLILPEW